MKRVNILGEDAKIEIEVLERCHPEAIGSWEGDWVKTTITVEIPGYSAFFQADLRTEEFKDFHDQLATMNSKLERTAMLMSIENAIAAKAVLNSQGSIFWEVATRFPVGEGTLLTFEFGSDQSYLTQLIKELDEVLTEFPVLERQTEKKRHFNDFFRKTSDSRKK